MFKFSLILSLSFTLFYAQELNSDITVYAKNIKSDSLDINATEDVLVIGNSSLIKANSATFNVTNSNLILDGNINIFKDTNMYLASQNLKANLECNELYLKPFFAIDSTNSLWIKSVEGNFSESRYDVSSSLLSSCSISNPDWSIAFKSGTYYEKEKKFELYHTTLNLGKVPILYLPYFTFSTNKERKSGLLRPIVGISNDEGINYSQPIYIAPAKNFDIELAPQVRTKRGKGLYQALRYKNSPNSYLELKGGYFKENIEYFDKFNLKNDKHYGYELYYIKNNLISNRVDFIKKDGIYFDGTYLNDIEYLNLKNISSERNSRDNLVISKLNYYGRDDKNYIGMYGRYFIDTTKDNNRDTLQQLPSIQYHRFGDKLFYDNILYYIDLKSQRNYREVGLNANQYELSIPISYYFSLFSDYLNVGVTENLYLSKINYSNSDININDGQYIRNYHTISLFSDLAKKYDNFLHSILFETNYLIPSFNNKRGDFADFINFNKPDRSLEFKISQYFYNLNGENFLIHRLRQPINFENRGYDESLENELRLILTDEIELYNSLFYSHKESRISSSTTKIEYNNDNNKLFARYFFKDLPQDRASFITFGNEYKLDNHTIFTEVDYDYNGAFFKNWMVGVEKSKKCIEYRISYKEELVPTLTTIGSGSIMNKIIYFEINLIPLGGFKQKFYKNG